MNKTNRDHVRRRRVAKWIRAASRGEIIQWAADPVEWIQAQASSGEEPRPKRFSMVAYTGGAMQVSAYGLPVVIDLAGLRAEAPVPILLDHDSAQIVGHADEVERTDTRLALRGVISGASQAAEQVVASAAAGFPWRASVGVRPDKMEFVGEDVSVTVNQKSLKGPLYVARKAMLGEVSFVAVAADSRTSVKVAATAAHSKGECPMDFQQWLLGMGLVLAELRDDQKAKLQAKYDAELKSLAAAGNKPVEAAAKELTVPEFDVTGIAVAHETHLAAIEAAASKCQGKIADGELSAMLAQARRKAAELKATALRESWATPRLEAEHIKAAALFEADLEVAQRPKAPAIHASRRDMMPEVIQAAFCRTAGLQSMERYFRPEILEAADRYRNFGIQEMLLMAAGQNGYQGRQRIGNDNIREVIRAAFSTSTITTMLTQSGNNILLDGFTAVPQTWREVAEIRAVPDFKTMTAFRLTASLEYEEVGPGGEIHHGTVGQESYTFKADTYGRMLAITRQDIINDDLGAFQQIRERLGLGAAMKMNKVFWTAWLAASAGGAFWTSARGNLVTSASLGESGLNSAVQAFRDMTGPDGNLLGLEPDRLIVPSTLEATARKLYVSQEMRDTNSSRTYQTANIFYNRFRPVVVPELSNSAYTGYSTTTWFLAANPAVLASGLMCFLNGQQNPTIESAEADFSTLGIQFRAYHDFGCAMTEYRASVKATA